MRTFTINNIPSSDFDIYLADSNLFDSAAEDVEYVEVPGRNGTLTISNSRFKGFTAKLDCYCVKDMQTNINAFKNHLMSLRGDFILKDSVHQGVFRIARNDSFKLDNSDKKRAVFTLEFNCRPEVYLDSGLTEVEITNGDILTNPTLFDSKPLIVVKGNGTLNIGNCSLEVDTAELSVTIDCEKMDCYNGNINCNNDVTLTDFPVLKSSDNEITFTGFTEFKITPRWWRV